MKVELVAFQVGDLQLEVIAETDLEVQLLELAWTFNGYKRGNGRTVTPKGNTGFYVPLCQLRAASTEQR